MDELLTQILAELKAINAKLDDVAGPMCPHGSSGFCMPCFRDMGIGWDIAQGMKR